MESHLAQLLVVQHLPSVKQKGRLHHALVDSDEKKTCLNVVFILKMFVPKAVRILSWFDDLKA
jgi:hypothetical protein